ncbi:MAG TPA: aminotransferase class III-fold pyridoxal phosphate-dependent enzyme [Candidatus Bathyarchaeia archaeon]|nr:aminotransferase class III-fold pyridoxal phosphate-dependent enzyme [Candidatus Bathyarchaeia archaeon]
MAKESIHLAGNYDSLDIMAKSAKGSWITDIEGAEYLDFLSSYSANNFGHLYTPLIVAAHNQLDEATLFSRAIQSIQLKHFADDLTELVGKDMMIPMNTGAEAVETGIKAARKWARDVKGVKDGNQNIIVAKNNFHGRTTTIVGFSSDEGTYSGFGPYTPGFRPVEFGKVDELADAIDANTAAVLIEPIQGEAGVIIPPDDYLPNVREITADNNVKLIFDEVQSGLGRTGKTLAAENWGVEPDAYLLGKALGGGILSVSAMVGDEELIGIFGPGEHGSTFGGMPFASAIGSKVVEILRTGYFQNLALERGVYLNERLTELQARGLGIAAFRSIGLWAGVDIDPSLATGKQVMKAMKERRVIVKDTHGSTLRFSPPLNITTGEIDFAMDAFEDSLKAVR